MQHVPEACWCLTFVYMFEYTMRHRELYYLFNTCRTGSSSKSFEEACHSFGSGAVRNGSYGHRDFVCCSILDHAVWSLLAFTQSTRARRWFGKYVGEITRNSLIPFTSCLYPFKVPTLFPLALPPFFEVSSVRSKQKSAVVKSFRQLLLNSACAQLGKPKMKLKSLCDELLHVIMHRTRLF